MPSAAAPATPVNSSDAAVSLSVSSSCVAAARNANNKRPKAGCRATTRSTSTRKERFRGRRARAHASDHWGPRSASISNTPGEASPSASSSWLESLIFLPPSSGAKRGYAHAKRAPVALRPGLFVALWCGCGRAVLCAAPAPDGRNGWLSSVGFYAAPQQKLRAALLGFERCAQKREETALIAIASAGVLQHGRNCSLAC